MVRMDDSKSDRALDSRVDSTPKELQLPWHWCDGADMADGVLAAAACDCDRSLVYSQPVES